ncbi:protein-(glutamine-N5) methyltransferase, release factor-specific [Piscirickettsia salmonis]|uniref:Release factor glutamine methyltransferase n=1 Tax=Piscirickettsia salmonis TaxID=1238 RepID=A0A9Q6LK61_PISSA|nr:peptide chain release factor N(5)-glutamine methyltransferase [Piscirickettsia salmonis]ALA24197.1 protein-(glutamine-N5) methyltransferase, release factor-specific [Piscirickettsia salmonis]APS44588.1 protein-(glutamine-N5) methyltransferase, release factor-specific [Piscirickettsia salmonis]APS47950.1 protein-(glutamine-N5) methyltransferase, release factor-specific [Piscirickettsia salmonis]APS51906.1 protein-(glutamine-N5) methyltransferase, release factor-specific [Piscirickettsia salmo
MPDLVIIQTALDEAILRLEKSVDLDNIDERFEAELLLGFVLAKNRAFLRAFAEKTLSSEQYQRFITYIHRRCYGEPIAYILGEREFWSLSLKVTAATLIPRPETEVLVDSVLNSSYLSKKSFKEHPLRIADLGTGSGAIACALAHSRPRWQLDAVDFSREALMVAKENAGHLGLNNINFYYGSWCEPLQGFYDAIVANPPYIEDQDQHLVQGDVRFEPHTALVSGQQGLDDIALIISQAPAFLKPQGLLALEHGYQQGAAVRDLFKQADFVEVQTIQDLSGQDRVTLAYYSGG